MPLADLIAPSAIVPALKANSKKQTLQELAAKAEAGFKFYASQEGAERLGVVFEEREITAEILRL